MIKVLHCADIHLDSPFHSKTPEQSALMRRELKKSFLSLINTVKTENISVVIMAGDVFDTPYVSSDTVRFFKDAVAEVPDTVFVISPGNHDPICDGGVYAGKFPENVHVFTESKLSYIDIEGTNLRIYGYAFVGTNTLEVCPFVGFKPEDESKINILCGHAELGDPLSPYCPVSLADIENSGFDYCGLGHIHLNDGVNMAGSVHYAYSGCLNGRDFGETGKKGAIIITFDGKKPTFENIIFSTYTYEEAKLDVSGITDGSELRRRISALVSEYSDTTFLRVELVGFVPTTLNIDVKALENEINGVFSIEIRDLTLPLYGTEQLKNDPTIVGEFFRSLLPMLENGTPEERRTAAKALRIGIAALKGEDVSG
jgi:DNA repair exonuclease SbcCD nuclease subunit